MFCKTGKRCWSLNIINKVTLRDIKIKSIYIINKITLFNWAKPQCIQINIQLLFADSRETKFCELKYQSEHIKRYSPGGQLTMRMESCIESVDRESSKGPMYSSFTPKFPWKHTHTHTHAHTHTCTYTCMHTQRYAHTNTHAHTQTCTHSCARTHTHTHTHNNINVKDLEESDWFLT